MPKKMPYNVDNIFKSSFLNQVMFGFVTAKIDAGLSCVQAVQEFNRFFNIDEDDAPSDHTRRHFYNMRKEYQEWSRRK